MLKKQKKVYLMSGVSGSGKSTWVKSQMMLGDEWISRDNVRFSIVREDEEYFSHEEEVFDTFIDYINQTLKNPNVNKIYIDATHLNKKSRNKTLNRIHKNLIDELNCVFFDIPEEVCLLRNSWRSGREFVPETVIKNMKKVHTMPDKSEKFDHIYVVNENGIVREVDINE